MSEKISVECPGCGKIFKAESKERAYKLGNEHTPYCPEYRYKFFLKD